MMGTFEVIAKKNGKRIVKYYTVLLKDGIADVICNLCKRMNMTDIDIRLM